MKQRCKIREPISWLVAAIRAVPARSGGGSASPVPGFRLRPASSIRLSRPRPPSTPRRLDARHLSIPPYRVTRDNPGHVRFSPPRQRILRAPFSRTKAVQSDRLRVRLLTPQTHVENLQVEPARQLDAGAPAHWSCLVSERG